MDHTQRVLLVATALLTTGLLTLSGLAAAQRPHDHAPGAENECGSYDRDVRAEIAMLSGESESVIAADKPSGTLPVLQVARGYRVTLSPRSKIDLPTEPTGPAASDGSFAGLLAFRVPVSGTYRVSLSRDAWVDVLDEGQPLEATDFSGREDCPELRKLVGYELQAGPSYVLMLSGATDGVIGVALAPAHHAHPR